ASTRGGLHRRTAQSARHLTQIKAARASPCYAGVNEALYARSLSCVSTNKSLYARLPLMLLIGAALLIAIWAGLVRLGWSLPGYQPGWIGSHGPLMVSGVLGMLICLERAVALAAVRPTRIAYLVPALSGAGGALLLLDVAGPAPRPLIG